MSTIYLDPVAMEATAGAVAEHAREVESSAATVETACTADVPPHLAAWLAEELRDISVVSRLAAVLYQVAAIDTAMRAQQIRIDQSLVTALPDLASPAGVATMDDLSAALGGSTVVGSTWSADVVRIDPGPLTVGTSASVVVGTAPIGQGVQLVHPGPLEVGVPTQVVGTLPFDHGVQLVTPGPLVMETYTPVHVGSRPDPRLEMQTQFAPFLIGIIDPGATLGPPGLTYVGGGGLEDGSGRQGSLSTAQPNPVNGRWEFV
jgi:hypothetical protein